MAVSFASMGLVEVSPALRVREDPTEVTYQIYEESGVDLGRVVHVATIKTRVESACGISAGSYNKVNCYQSLLWISTCAATPGAGADEEGED
jgi:hypothetical protein